MWHSVEGVLGIRRIARLIQCQRWEGYRRRKGDPLLSRSGSTSVRSTWCLAAGPLRPFIRSESGAILVPHAPRVVAGAAEELPLRLVAFDDVFNADESRPLAAATLGSIGHGWLEEAREG
jgi:hypothetical protein